MKPAKGSIPIKRWSADDRPREKLLNKGARLLSNSELLALLIGSGSRDETAVQLGKRIMASVNNSLAELSKLTPQELMRFDGIGQAKSEIISAAFEISRRREKDAHVPNEPIRSSADVYDVMKPIMADLNHEEFWILYLNNSNRLIQKKQLSKGGITGTLVDVRLVLKHALDYRSTALILVHNHPSGTLKPSSADKHLTDKLKTACSSMDLKVLDHVIIAEKAYFSFADEGLL